LDDRFLTLLEARHLADLRFSDVTRALRALSSAYVERRESALAAHKVLDGAGKRAAFALYYGPLHFLMTRAILREVAGAEAPALQGRAIVGGGTIIDLGCGTGVAGAAVALEFDPPLRVVGIDTHPWALDEARFTYRAFDLHADVKRGHAARVHIPRDVSFVVAAFVVNELNEDERPALRATLLDAAKRGVAILIIEPISLRVSPWWAEWAEAFLAAGGRADEWRIPIELPPIVKKLARASGLRPELLTARSLALGFGLDRG
jgi:SAM-dependent methyltransferase